MKIAVIGAGAMGSIYAGLLADAGNEVWAIDVWREHIDVIRESGLRVEGASGDRIVREHLHTSTQIADTGPFDLIIVATKAHDVASAARSIQPILTGNTLVLAMQNGLGAAERMQEFLPADNILLGIGGGFGASVRGPGHVHHNGMAMINIGEPEGGITERLQRVVSTWSEAGFNAHAFENIDQLIWEKLICNCTFSAPCTVFGRTVREMLDDPHARQIALTCGIEAWETGRAAGVPISIDDPEPYLLEFAAGVLDARPSMLQDHLARRRSEIDFINGAIPEIAARVGTSAPYNEVVSAVVRSREAGFQRF